MRTAQALIVILTVWCGQILIEPNSASADTLSVTVLGKKVYCESDGTSAYEAVKKNGKSFVSYDDLISQIKERLRDNRSWSAERQLRRLELEYRLTQRECSNMAIAVVTGFSHSCALLGDRSVVCWGAGRYLGYGNGRTIGDDERPFRVGKLPLDNKVIQLSSNGASHTCAVLANGRVTCWGGGGQYGALGYGNTNDLGDDESLSSIGTVRLTSKARQVSASYTHTCALLDSKKVQCWGYGEYGALGYGNKENIGDDEDPISAGYVKVGEDVAKVVTGQNVTCALTVSGKVKCWGAAVDGVLGQGTSPQENIGDDETPDQIPFIDVGGTARDISASKDHVCAILEDERIKCWGANAFGKLGYGHTQTIGDDETPSTEVPISMRSGVKLIASSDTGTCALQNNGKIKCWGYRRVSTRVNPAGFEAYGNDESLSRVPSISLPSKASHVAHSYYHTCAILEGTRRVTCWGQNNNGELGNGNVRPVPDDLVARQGRVVKLVRD